ncbi:hypothetical protein B0H12DRAFT_1076474 [Mycena haematopus]|nr:hypothetical protein B0H12DRAFT_1076474 [Mycena haematopus]
MRFTTLFTAVAVAVTGASAQFSAESITNALTLNAANHYGAPIPPWEVGHYPGWYYGSGPFPDGILCWLDELLCELLDLFPFLFHCPKPPHNPPPEYTPTFTNQTCATQDNSYQTFGLVDTIADCEAMCDSVSGCTFVNTYHDVNGKDGSTQLTCSLFTTCLTAASNDNCGGQSQPDGSVDFITNSDGYCKKTPTA